MPAPTTEIEPTTGSGDDDPLVLAIRDALLALEDERHDDAILACERALGHQVLCPEALYILGLTGFELDTPSQAIQLLEKAHELSPEIREYAEALAAIHARLGSVNDSLYFAKMSVAARPHPIYRNMLPARFGSFFTNLDNAEPDLYLIRAEGAFASGDFANAVRFCETQLDVTPSDNSAMRLLGHAARLTGGIERAVAAFHAVLHGDDAQAADLSALAQALSAGGRHAEAAAGHATASGYAPEDARLHSRLLADLVRDPDMSARDLIAAHAAWNGRHAAEPRPPAADRDRDPERPLRVGYLLGSLLDTTVMQALEPILRLHDRSRYQCYAYVESMRTDAQMERIMRIVDRWTDLEHIDDETVWQILRTDDIDILVDLVGHREGGRPLVLSRRPAPVAVGWLGYPHGLVAVDYVLADEAGRPAARSEDAAGAPIWRLPRGVFTYEPPALIPALAPPPAQAAGHPTLGAQCDLAHISAHTAALWAALVRSVPGSGLLICNRLNLDQACIDRCLEYFSHMGLRQAVEIVNAADNFATEFEFYQHVDLALDPAPDGDATETCRALWMGVPMLALRGDRPGLGPSVLTAAEHPEWIADTLDDLLRIAGELLDDVEQLAALRAGLRDQVAGSALGDAEGFTRSLEAAFRDMWRAWCADGAG